MSDLDRLRREYDGRERRFAGDDRYSPSNPTYRFMKAQLRNELLALFKQRGQVGLDSRHVLEVGCGNGNVLMDLQSLGGQDLHGIDLLPARLHQAHASYPSFTLACADGRALPYAAGSFKLVAQFTAFTSILDDDIKKDMAMEMQRVLKPDGSILWYDFWWNPINRQTRGIALAELKRLFNGMQVRARKVTLAPPIARWIAPRSLPVARWLESLRVLNSHYLALIEP